MTYKITEMFNSYQGEGSYLGTPTFFIRFHGCNLTCSFCDEASKSVCVELKEDTLIAAIKTNMTDKKHLVLTGGEPLLQVTGALIKKLITELPNCSIQIETNGTLPFKTDEFNPTEQELLKQTCFITCSPKKQSNFLLHETLVPFLHEIKLINDGLTQEDILPFYVYEKIPIWLQPCWTEDWYIYQESVRNTLKLIESFTDSNLRMYSKLRLGIQAQRYWHVK